MSLYRGNDSNPNPPGVPRSDLERMMNHYGVDESEAWSMLEGGTPLPPRGSNLSAGLIGDTEPWRVALAVGAIFAVMVIGAWVAPKVVR